MSKETGKQVQKIAGRWMGMTDGRMFAEMRPTAFWDNLSPAIQKEYSKFFRRLRAVCASCVTQSEKPKAKKRKVKK